MALRFYRMSERYGDFCFNDGDSCNERLKFIAVKGPMSREEIQFIVHVVSFSDGTHPFVQTKVHKTIRSHFCETQK